VFSALESIKTGGGTALFRALLDAVPTLNEASHSRTVLLLISDGNDYDPDSSGRVSVGPTESIRTAEAIRRSGVALYAIGIGMGREPVNQ
jgi:Mg-chelatase subunit ChlD